MNVISFVFGVWGLLGLVNNVLMEKIMDDLVYKIRVEERNRAVQAIMSLFFALRSIKGKPTLKDLVKLAKRIKR